LILPLERNNVLGDGIGYVHLIDKMGGQQRIVNRGRKCYQSQDKSTPDGDARLLKRLVGSKPLHGTTLRNTIFTFDVLAPQFVVRQWTRHIVGQDSDGNDVWHTGGQSFDMGGAYDEQSFRYTDKIAFYTPPDLPTMKRNEWATMCDVQRNQYEMLRQVGFDKQLARCALGPAVYSQFETTVNAQAILDWFSKRLPGGGAQGETEKYAIAVLSLVREIVPSIIEVWESQKGNP
jgi:thymidylate synthase (FAD)